ncbi:type II toxin-antitoxin system Phd/YefM family antitoxin [Candidatus Microgenomates bacterium]|nr:type II toxin-antitoxin system Phd/YefM family antitoxin [Candidatus Microgenomates bacterium]
MNTISATRARANLYDLVDKVAKSGKRVGITKKGETKVVLISAEEYESWQETNEIMADKGLMRAIRQGEKDLKAGRVYDWEDVKKELGIDV